MNPPTADAIGRLVAARPLRELARTLAQAGAASASGLWGSSVAAVVAAVTAELRRPAVIVCGHLDEADDLAGDIELFTGRRPDVLPARIHFSDDQIESIKRFDLDSMGSLETLDSLRLNDLKGQLPESSESVSLFRYMPEDAIVFLWAPLEIAEQAKSYLDRLPEV